MQGLVRVLGQLWMSGGGVNISKTRIPLPGIGEGTVRNGFLTERVRAGEASAGVGMSKSETRGAAKQHSGSHKFWLFELGYSFSVTTT